MSGISAHALRVEDRLARDELAQRRAPHRYPCTDPHAVGCTETSGQKHRACPACNKRSGLSHTYRSTRDAP